MSEKLVIGIDPSFSACGVSDGIEHAIFSAPKASEGAHRAGSTRSRSFDLASAVANWISDRLYAACRRHDDTGMPVAVYIEAPMLSSLGGGAGHLYELGWLMNDLYRLIEAEIPQTVTVHEVPSSTVRKFATGKGNTPKTQMSLAVFKRFGVEFEKDPGCDKLFAYCLQRYGVAAETGEIVHVASRPRGKGARSTRIVKKRARAAA